VTAHAQEPDFVFRRNGRVHLNRRGRQFSRLLAAEVCASAVVVLDTPFSEVVWRVLATHSIRQFPLHFSSRASLCAITFQLQSTSPPFNCGQEQILRQKRCVGALLRHQTMGISHKLSNPVWERHCLKLTSTTTKQNSQKSTSNFKILYRKVRFGLLSRWNSLYRRNQRNKAPRLVLSKHRYCQRNWHASQYPSLTEIIAFRERRHNVALYETAHMEPVISSALLQSPTPTDNLFMLVKSISLQNYCRMKSLKKAVSIPNAT